MKLNEAKQILKKSGYLLEVGLSPVERAADVAYKLGYETLWDDREEGTLLIYEDGDEEIDIVDTENYDKLSRALSKIKGLGYSTDVADSTCLAVWNK